MKLKYLIPS